MKAACMHAGREATHPCVDCACFVCSRPISTRSGVNSLPGGGSRTCGEMSAVVSRLAVAAWAVRLHGQRSWHVCWDVRKDLDKESDLQFTSA